MVWWWFICWFDVPLTWLLCLGYIVAVSVANCVLRKSREVGLLASVQYFQMKISVCFCRTSVKNKSAAGENSTSNTLAKYYPVGTLGSMDCKYTTPSLFQKTASFFNPRSIVEKKKVPRQVSYVWHLLTVKARRKPKVAKTFIYKSEGRKVNSLMEQVHSHHHH